MREIVSSLTVRNRAEAYHDAAAKKEEALQMFKLGLLGLEERAVVESLFWKLARGIAEMNRGKKRLPRETKDLGDKIADQYLANFSLFQSAPITGPSTSSSPSSRSTAWTSRPPATAPSST